MTEAVLTGEDPAQRKGRWPSSVNTKRRVLDAAGNLFSQRGYDSTAISDIVAASGVSTGSIYHQFGGKAEIFMALARDLLSRHAHVSERAMAKARDRGTEDAVQIYLVGAEAYLLDVWKHRDVERALYGGDGPPGFSKLFRDTGAKYVHAALGLRLGDPPLPDSSARAVTALLLAAVEQLLTVENRKTAKAVAVYFLDLIHQLTV